MGFRTSQSSPGKGLMISPSIEIVPFMQPNAFFFLTGGGGVTKATGFPLFVISNGLPVIFTCSSNDKQVALNFEIAILSTSYPLKK